MGATLGLPLLPLFLEHRGGTPHVIGYIVASFFIAGVVTQFALGHLADKYGRRRILLSALVVFGLASMTYVLPVTATWFTLTRVVQGASAGAIEVASMSAVAALFPETERGRAVSRIIAAQLLGIAIGPMVGALSSVRTLGWAFFGTGVVSLLAALVARATDLGEPVTEVHALPPIQWSGELIGALVGAAAIGVVVGVYETCWSLLMHADRASTLQIRLSWTMFCLPWVLLSSEGGRLADRHNRRVIATLGLLNAGVFLSIYPHIHNNNVMIFVGSFESIGAALSTPSISSLLNQGAVDRELSRRQGLYATANTATLALSAVVAGYLFTKSPSWPFTAAAILSVAMSATTLWWWRHTIGHVREVEGSSRRR